MPDPLFKGTQARYVPTVLRGIDGEPPTYVSARVADSPAAAFAYAVESGERPEGEGCGAA